MLNKQSMSTIRIVYILDTVVVHTKAMMTSSYVITSVDLVGWNFGMYVAKSF